MIILIMVFDSPILEISWKFLHFKYRIIYMVATLDIKCRQNVCVVIP